MVELIQVLIGLVDAALAEMQADGKPRKARQNPGDCP